MRSLRTVKAPKVVREGNSNPLPLGMGSRQYRAGNTNANMEDRMKRCTMSPARDRKGRFTRNSLRPYPSLVGKRYGNLKVLRFAGIEPRADGLARIWKCRCVCGNIHFVNTNALQSGRVRGCGCGIIKRAIEMGHAHRKHGHCRVRNGIRQNSPTWNSWRSMHMRCSDKKNPIYGGKNPPVTVCKQWTGKNGFITFLSKMGKRPRNKTLDRYPNPNGNYEPGNTRWSTATIQNRNKSESLRSIALRAWETRRANLAKAQEVAA
jgi:hypothetical protein